MPPYGITWVKKFRESGLRPLERLADKMYLGPSMLEGLTQASKNM